MQITSSLNQGSLAGFRWGHGDCIDRNENPRPDKPYGDDVPDIEDYVSSLEVVGSVSMSSQVSANNLFATGNYTAFCDEFPSSYESASPLCALTVSTFTFTNFYRFEEQIISPDKYQDSENIIASSMQEIYNFVSENWDSEVWNLSDSSLPTLKD